MAWTGVHIEFGFVSSPSSVASAALQIGQPVSQTMGSAGTSTVSASAPGPNPVLSLSASAPIFYATGPNPDPSATSAARRYYDPAWGRLDIFVAPNDKVAWIFA